jgi:hypothetical protein
MEVVTASAAKWANLRWRVRANRKNLYFASPTARLTPSGGTTPCIYLAPDERTSFLELYGDGLQLAREAGLTPAIAASDFVERVYLDVAMPELRLADLSTGAGIEAVQIDLGTLHAADPNFPRAFAESIVQHPARVDGILYESRHTKERCAVVWHAHSPALADVPFGDERPLSNFASVAGKTATVFGIDVLVTS